MRTSPAIQNAIEAMLDKQLSIKEIARTLKVSKNTVRKVKSGTTAKCTPPDGARAHLEEIRTLFKTCKGNAIRIHEELAARYGIKVSYQTVTRLIREAHLRDPPKRAGQYLFGPGEEMQHDTSPHRVEIGGKQVTAQCASLVLACSRMTFIQYYPAFTRFEARWFLTEAIRCFGGACGRCMVDNTSVAVVKGSGEYAVFAPELVSLAKAYGFHFAAHEVGDANRSARVERNFHYAENNFLAGRTFEDWQALNHQARAWCDRVNAKPKRALGMTPQAAFLAEKPHLRPLPIHEPPVYNVEHRRVDNEGYVRLDANRYSVPERLLGKQVDVYKYPTQVDILFANEKVASHARLMDGREVRVTAPGHHQPRPRASRRAPCAEERLLRGRDPDLDRFVVGLKSRAHGRGARAFQQLLHLERLYPEAAFLAAIRHALDYNLFDLSRLESLILKHVADDFFEIRLDPEDPLP